MNDLSVITAFVGGVLTFLAPCTFPLLPAYLAFLVGPSSQDTGPDRAVVLIRAFLFVLGFTGVFVLFGLLTGFLGTFLTLHRTLLSQIGGLIVLMIGSMMAFRVSLLHLQSMQLFPKWLMPGRAWSALLLGVFFGLGWSPCVGPVLGTILLLAGTSGSAAYGTWLLLVYAFGLSIPFLLLALVSRSAMTVVAATDRYVKHIDRIAGLLLVVIGIMLLTKTFGLWNIWIHAGSFGGWYGRLMDFM